MELMNDPWVITIVGGVLVAVITLFIKKTIKKSRVERSHRLDITKDSKVKVGGSVYVGNVTKSVCSGKSQSEHEIHVSKDSEIDVDGDLVDGDTEDK